MLADGRALRAEFLDVMRRHGALKPRKQFALWRGTKRAGGISNRTLAALCEGRPVDSQWIQLLIEFLLDPKAANHEKHQLVLAEYCALLGKPVSAFSKDLLVRAVSHARERTSVNEPETLPALLSALARYLAPLGRAGLLELVRPALLEPQTAGSPSWISTVCRWVYIEHGRQHSKRRLSEEQAIALAVTKIGTDLASYSIRVHAWAEREPWTVTLARVQGAVVGASVAVPVTSTCFERASSGEINTWEVTPSDLRSPSLDVIAESVTMVPARGFASARAVTVPVYSAIMTQVAYLTAVEGAGDRLPIRILSADFSPRSKHNLDRAAFESTPVSLPGTDQRLRRRTIDLTEMAKADYEFFGFWRMLQANLGGPRVSPARSHSSASE